MTWFTVFILTLIASVGAVAWRFGGAPEKFAGAILVVWAALDTSYHLMFGLSDFKTVDPVHVELAATELVAMVWLALRANRIWPLFAAAAQLICLMGHLAALLETEGMRRAYWTATQIPPFFELIAVLSGTFAHVRRTHRLGNYRSWRPL
ncbi:MAG TPA: hypothetical protein VL100_06400 [Croceibacterium sp.]|nr:hypothetical protein [Croceibacterium sp.]